MDRNALKSILSNPIVGFAPWIVMSVLTGPGRFELAAVIALVLAILAGVLGAVVGMRPKLLDIAGIVFFGAMIVVGLIVDKEGIEWLERWSGELSNVMIALVALFSVAIRLPFTIQYAREQTPREYWDSPRFKHINYVITWGWIVAFVVSALAGWYGAGPLEEPNNIWFGWVIQIGAIVLAVRFTEWYPDWATARFAREDGETPEEDPTVADLFLPLATYLVPVGVIVLIAGGTPWWVGVGLIVIGGALSKLLHDSDEQASSARDAR